MAASAASPTEVSVESAEQQLLERIRDEFLLETYSSGDDPEAAAERFDASGVASAVQAICADEKLRELALSEHTEIHVEVSAAEGPLFRFENGAGDASSDHWHVNADFPLGVALVICGDLVANASPQGWSRRAALAETYQRQAKHRRAEEAYFAAEAEKCRAESPALGSALDELADACGGDANMLEPEIPHLRQWRQQRLMSDVLLSRRHMIRRGAPTLVARRLDRRLACPRPRARALARASSRGGDSGDSDDPEPARRGVRVGDTSRSFRASLHPADAARFDAILPDLELWGWVAREARAHQTGWVA